MQIFVKLLYIGLSDSTVDSVLYKTSDDTNEEEMPDAISKVIVMSGKQISLQSTVSANTDSNSLISMQISGNNQINRSIKKAVKKSKKNQRKLGNYSYNCLFFRIQLIINSEKRTDALTNSLTTAMDFDAPTDDSYDFNAMN
jgi:hypothetical protein